MPFGWDACAWPAAALEPFFEQVYEQCAVERPAESN